MLPQKMSPEYLGDDWLKSGDERKCCDELYLGNEQFRREGTVLTAAAQIAVQALDDIVDTHKSETVALAFDGLKNFS